MEGAGCSPSHHPQQSTALHSDYERGQLEQRRAREATSQACLTPRKGNGRAESIGTRSPSQMRKPNGQHEAGTQQAKLPRAHPGFPEPPPGKPTYSLSEDLQTVTALSSLSLPAQ